jgi:hypothetical protein
MTVNYSTAPDFIPPQIIATPPGIISCFAESAESSPWNLILCLIYFLGTGAATAFALYLYLRDRSRNAH